MRKDTKIVKVSTSRYSKKLVWPQLCVLCLKEPTKEHYEVFKGSGKVPYCSNCYSRVERLNKWENKLTSIALIIGVLIAVLITIGSIVQMGFLEFFKQPGTVVAMALVLMPLLYVFLFTFLAYAIMWFALLPFRLIFRSKLAKPGVKRLKSKKSDVEVLKFSNPEYADIFRKANETTILT